MAERVDVGGPSIAWNGHGDRLVEVVLANGRCLRVCPAIDAASLARLIRVVEGT